MSLNFRIIIVVSICSFACTTAQDASTLCVNDLVQWCGDMEKPPNFMGNFMTTDYSSRGGRQIVHCIAGTGGINCTLNNYPWFACRPDGSVTYKNNVLQEGSSVPDDDVCDASKKARNMFTYNSAEVKAAMEAGRRSYERAMSNVRNTMNNIQNKLSRPCFPFCGHNPFGNGFPFNG
ncbi:uncharacterized protein [Parasteatoda tepidariorum]|uniref:uncharacterized protein n=1 Tax=Parasteatoda tepidariorum TaxID=114398 RepID=UPI001C7230B8|nr:uncharacterized protein LOC110282259 [Parasteatoda tepidariorum]